MSSWLTRPRLSTVLKALQIMALLCSLAWTAGAQTLPPAGPGARVAPLEVTLNGLPQGIWPIVESAGAYYAPLDAFESWRVRRDPGAEPIEYRGLSYHPIAGIPGAQVQLDAAQGVLAVVVAPEAFAATRISRELTAREPRDPVIHSLFVNYDLSYNRSQARGAAAIETLGLYGEAGYASPLGLLTSSFLARGLHPNGQEPREFVRLVTALRKDFPDHDYTLTVGDSVLRSGYLGRGAYFGGVQFGTNFRLAPDLNRQPVPILSGEARAPSTVQLYVNNVLRQTTNLGAGPFTLDNLPPLTGNGQVSVVVRDVLGRETVITQPFFIPAELLQPGVNDWSAEVGRLHENLGGSDSRYTDLFASGMWRRGISNTLTVEGRGEVSRDLRVAGAAAVLPIGSQLLTRFGVMASHERTLGSGLRWIGGMDWMGQAANTSFTLERNTRSFRSLGESPTAPLPRTQLSAQFGYMFGARGRLGVALAAQDLYDQDRVLTLGASYSVNLPRNWQLSLGFSRVVGPTRGTSLNAVLNVPLSRAENVLASTQSSSGKVDTYASYSRNATGTFGTAWRVLGGVSDGGRAEAGVYHFGEKAVVTGDISSASGASNLRLGASGGLVLARGRMFLVPRHDAGAVLVQVPGYENVGIGLGSTPTARTDAKGYALVPNLTAYRKNLIRIDPNDLPVTAEIDNIERAVVPSWRSVSEAVFPVRGGRGAVIRIVLADGEPAPAGAIVRIEGEERDFYVGRRGEAYVTGLGASNALRLQWKGAQCTLNVNLPEGSADQVERVGPLSCAGVAR